MVEDHRLGAALGLTALARIVDDEGIEMGHGAQGPFREARLAQAHPLPRQPFEIAVLPHMHHHLSPVHLADPEIVRQVGVGGRQVGAVISAAQIPLVASTGLNQQGDGSEAEASDRKDRPGGPGGEAAIPFRRSPNRLQGLATRLGKRGIPGLIGRERQRVQRRPMITFRIVGAPPQQGAHQGLPISRQGLVAHVVSLLPQGVEDGGGAGGRIQPHPIGQAAIASGVIGQHQGKAPLPRRALAEGHPAGGQLHHPDQASGIGLESREPLGRGQTVPMDGQGLAEGADTGRQPTIQLWKGHLQAQILGPQPHRTPRPALPGTAAGEELQHRHIQTLPERRPQPRFREGHRSEGRGADHSLHLLLLKPIPQARLHGGIPQATHPERSRTQAPLPQRAEQGLHQGGVSRLAEGAIQHHAHPRAGIVSPVVGKGIGFRHGAGGSGQAAGQKPCQGLHHQSQIGAPAHPEAVGQGAVQGGRHAGQGGQKSILLRGARQDEQVTVGTGLLPTPQLLQAITPVAATAEEAHEEHAGVAQGVADVVIDHRGVRQAPQGHSPQGVTQGGGALPQHPLQGQQIRGRAAQHHHLRGAVADEWRLLSVEISGACGGGQTMHLTILLAAVRRSGQLDWPDAPVSSVRLVWRQVRALRRGHPVGGHPRTPLRHRGLRGHARSAESRGPL